MMDYAAKLAVLWADDAIVVFNREVTGQYTVPVLANAVNAHRTVGACENRIPDCAARVRVSVNS